MKILSYKNIIASLIVAGFLFGATFFFFAQAATIINDVFADGNSRNQDLANNSLQLFSARTTFTRTDAVGSVNFAYNSGSSDAYWAHFTALNNPVALNVGDNITFTTVAALTFSTARTGSIRFGFFDSAGTRRTTDATGGINDALFGNDVGYAAEIFPHTSNFATLWRRDVSNPTTNNIFNSMGATGDGLSQISATANPTTTQTFTSGSDYTLTYTVTRTGTTTTEITYRAVGPDVDKSVTGTETSNLPYTKFDYFILRTAGTSLADSIRFKQFKVDYNPAAPTITTQPAPSNQTIAAGSNVQYSVGASGSGISYQWFKGGVAIAGNASATTATLQLTNVLPENSGVYTVVVSNSGGSVTSNPVTLNVTTGPTDPLPVINQQPANTSATIGSPASLTVGASGLNLTYQWFKDGAVIGGANSVTLSFAAVQPSDTANYTVTVSNSGGTVTSNPARLTVVSTIAATAFSPQNQAIGLCADTPLSITFNQTPKLGTSGRIRVYRADGTLVDTIDLAAAAQTKVIGGTTFNYYPVIISGNTASISLHQQLAYNQNYYVTLEPGVITDASNVPFAGFSDATTFTFTTKPAAPAAGANSLTVAADNTGDFCTIQGAVDFVPNANTQRVIVTVKNGTYTEIVSVPGSKPLITVRGESRAGTVQRYANNNSLNPSTTTRPSFNVNSGANDFNLETITLQNSTAQGGSQAEAFRSYGLRVTLNSVNLLSFQDTILTQGSTFINNSYIEGDVDFMWGTGAAYFKNSELKMLREGLGYYTQIRNPANGYGNIYVNCRLTKAAGVTNGSYLSRIDPDDFPGSQVVFIDSQMDSHILPVGWRFDNPTNAVTAANYPNIRFWEYNTTALDGTTPIDCSQRHPIARNSCNNPLTADEANFFRTPANVLGFTPQEKLSATVALGNLTQVYDGTAKSVAVTTDPANLPVTVTYNGSTPLPVNAGTYTVVATVNDANYQGTATGTLTIAKAPATITLGNLTQNFDGAPKSVSVVTTPPGVATAVTYNGSTTAPTAIGNYTVVVTVTDPNYSGSATGVLNIKSLLRAFPEAEGAGAYSIGGRGGDVYRVTNLNDAGAGSLRNGITSATGARTIVFDVSGTINLTAQLNINKSFLTIAGQTAPGDGITVAGWSTVVTNAQHVVIRYVRFRPGDQNCPAMQGDSLSVDRSKDVMIDHVSASWSIDESLSVTDSDRVSVQWSMISESLNNSCHSNGSGGTERHGYGSLIRYGSGRVSFHHNLYAHHFNRNPRVGDNITLDFVNNVIYDWGTDASYSGGADEGTTKVNYVGNYLVAGPNTPVAKRTRAFSGGSVNTLIYRAGNLIDGNVNGVRDGTDTGLQMFVGLYTLQDGEFRQVAPTVIDINADAAATAYNRVLNAVGSSRARDAVDVRIVTQVQNETGAFIDSQTQVGGYPALASLPARTDTDGDGIPDDWETARGLNPNDPNDARATAANGYTNLENYLNGSLAPTAAGVTVGGRVLTAAGRGIGNVRMTLLNGATGETRTVKTNPFGFYSFNEVAAGQSYVVTVNSKRFSFVNPAQALTVNEEIATLNFVANE